MSDTKILLDASAIDRAIREMAQEIWERNRNGGNVVIVGIQRGGVRLAERIAYHLQQLWGEPVPVGSVDVGMYRDDIGQRVTQEIRPTNIPSDINGKTVILVDDVLFHGRTARAAMEALNDYGRPDAIQLAVLIDRGHRELPIKADFVGETIDTTLEERVNVRLREDGGEELVCLDRL